MMNIPVVGQCNGCDKVEFIGAGKDVCKVYPATKWRLGTCRPSATHIKRRANTEESKIRLGRQKQKKN